MKIHELWCHQIKRACFVIVLLAFVLSVLYPDLASAVRLPSGNRECAICHIMWLDEFKRKDVIPLVPYDPKPVEDTGKQDVASTEKMCFSCHDGFVLDSRFLWKNNRHNHPVGVEPSPDVQIPTAEGKTIFPLNEDGKIYCGTCHTAHGVEWDVKDSPIFLRMENKNSRMCMACHLNRSTGPKHGNHPVGDKIPDLPSTLARHGSFLGEKNKIICQSCHKTHAADGKKILAIDNSRSQLCAACHKVEKQVRKTKHNMAIMEPGLRNVRNQKASNMGPCSACHVPHGAKGPHLWGRKLSAGTDLSSALCKSCHNLDGSAHKKTVGKYTHPVDVPIRKAGITAKEGGWLSSVNSVVAGKDIKQLPLFDKHGNLVSEGGNVTCITCHDPHRWSANHGDNAVSNIRDQEGDSKNSFLRIRNDDDSELCKNCHRDKASVVLSKHNLHVSAPEEKNSNGRTVTEDGVCSACHMTHNGKGPWMWSRQTRSADSEISAMCYGCHQKDGMAKEKTIGEHSHPVHVSTSKPGISTQLPLFHKNGYRDDRNGLIDCATCHDPHQWDPGDRNSQSGMSNDVEGSASDSFLRARASGNAALCGDCHKDEAIVVNTDHDMRITAPDSQNALGRDVRESGVCGQCHAVHNANQSFRLWVQEKGHGEDDLEKMCTSCHREGGTAKLKVPDKLTHPPNKIPIYKGELQNLSTRKILPPVFNLAGEHVDVGRISCPTCHNPHKWDPKRSKTGAGRNLEGDVRTSFLRHANTEGFLCADCHGEDSIYRYKYFHWDKSRSQQKEKKGDAQ